MIVVFDSTVLISNFHLMGPSFRLFKWFIENTDTKLVVPKVVVEEVKNKYRKSAKSMHDSYITKLKELDKHLDGLGELSNPSIDLDEYFEKFDDELDEKLKSYNTEIPSYKNIPHSALVQRDLAGTRPFRKIGKKHRESTGYRDCLIWETIVRKIAPHADEVIFVTANKYDFCDSTAETLHNDLKRDLRKNGLKVDLVKVCENIESFNKKFVIPKIPKVDKAKIDLERGEYYDFSIDKWFERNTSEIMNQLQEEIHIPLEEYFFEVVSSTITWIDIDTFSVDEVLELDGKTVLIDARINAIFSLDIDVISMGVIEDLYDLPLDMDFDIHDRNYASVTARIHLPIDLKILFDIDKKDVEEFEGEIPPIYSFCHKCGEPFLNDAAEKCSKCGK